MRIAIKIFLYIGIIGGAIIAFIAFIISFTFLPYILKYLISTLAGIIVFIVGLIGLKKLNTASIKSELTGIAICLILFGNMIAGILMFCASPAELFGYYAPTLTTLKEKQEQVKTKKDEKAANLGKELMHLKKLKDSGVIGESEYKRLVEQATDKYVSDKLVKCSVLFKRFI